MKNYLTAKLFRKIEDNSTLCYRGRDGESAIFQKVDKTYISIKQDFINPQDFILIDNNNTFNFSSSSKLISYIKSNYKYLKEA
ncbi:MAG: hypothetical protein ACRC18_06980 [Cetobacterium sp.]